MASGAFQDRGRGIRFITEREQADQELRELLAEEKRRQLLRSLSGDSTPAEIKREQARNVLNQLQTQSEIENIIRNRSRQQIADQELSALRSGAVGGGRADSGEILNILSGRPARDTRFVGDPALAENEALDRLAVMRALDAQADVKEDTATASRQALFDDFPFLSPESGTDIVQTGDREFETVERALSPKELKTRRQRREGASRRRSQSKDSSNLDALRKEKLELDVERARSEKQARIDPFNNYELKSPDKVPKLSNPEINTLRDADAAVEEGTSALSEAAAFIQERGIQVNPLSKNYARAIQIEKSLTDIFRRVQKAGANFTKNEEKIIDSIKGVLTGSVAAVRGKESALEIFSNAEKILMKKADSLFNARGFKRKVGSSESEESVRFKDPDGFVYEGTPEEARELAEAFSLMSAEERAAFRQQLG